MLSAKHSARLFFKLEPKSSFKPDKECLDTINMINQSWRDIEYLNYIFHIIYSKFTDKVDKNESQEVLMLFDSLEVLGQQFYVHLEIIKKLLTKNNLKNRLGRDFNVLYNKYSNVWKTIRIARHQIIIHKEKPNHLKRAISMNSTDPDVFIVLEGIYLDNKGKKEIIILKPLLDTRKVQSFLQDMQKLLQ